MSDEIDIRAEAAELFVQAAARVSAAGPEQMAGPQRLLERMLTAGDTDPTRASLRVLGEQIQGAVLVFLEELGEADLGTDVASIGFVASAALAFVTPELEDETRDERDPDLPA